MANQFFKFLIVGGVNFFFTLTLFIFFLRVIGFHYVLALVLASALGVIFTYTLNYVWVFLPSERLQFRERLPRYALANGVSIGLNAMLLPITVSSTGFDPFWAQFFLIPFIIVFNFATARFWSLKPATTE